MKGMLDKATVAITCPGCGHKTEKTVGWLKTHDEMVCAGCDRPIHLDDNGFRSEIPKADKALAGFRSKIRRIGKT